MRYQDEDDCDDYGVDDAHDDYGDDGNDDGNDNEVSDDGDNGNDNGVHLGGGEEEGARLSPLPLPQTPRIIFHLGNNSIYNFKYDEEYFA